MPEQGVSAVAVGAIGVGGILVWSGLKGASVLATVQALLQGRQPAGQNVRPISHEVADVLGGGGLGAGVAGAGNAAVLAMARQVQATGAGQAGYCWGGGHTNNPCSAKCFDCSGYVSCVLNRLGVLRGSMTTNGFLAWSGATTVPYADRQPGDIAVNTRHMGIVVDASTIIAARCTACGRPGVQTQRLTSAYRIRRVKGGGAAARQTEQRARTPAGRPTTAGL